SFCSSLAPSPRVIYTLSLHDALPISTLSHHRGLVFRFPFPADGPYRKGGRLRGRGGDARARSRRAHRGGRLPRRGAGKRATQLRDRKSTRLNSSHLVISYAVFCLKKK